jgi:hypothetical protein
MDVMLVNSSVVGKTLAAPYALFCSSNDTPAVRSKDVRTGYALA